MEVDSILSLAPQSAETPEINNQDNIPPYMKIVMKQMESISLAFQEQTKRIPNLQTT
jgi:hypothetical protein